MIVGVFIKGYKTYQSLTYVPLVLRPSDGLSIFIGKNGAGKSSIQEALDTLFNNRPWNQNILSKKGEGFVCPVFLISKRDRTPGKVIPLISEYFWGYQVPDNIGAANYDAWQDFVSHKTALSQKASYDDYHMIVIGRDEDGTLSYTKTHEKLKNSFRSKGVGNSDHDKALAYILDRYRYVYLPIHNSPTTLVELKAKELQALLDKNFVKEIERIINREDDKTSPLKNINSHLDSFVDEINSKLSTVEGSCRYGSSQSHKISTEDIIDVVLNKYFSKRPLQKDGKPIEHLSSGEQRVAIIDVAHAFLSKSTDTNKELIISIDEPEASLSPANCLRQFRKIFEISSIFGKQVLVSTHWYGLLMTPTPATLNHITRESDRPTVKSLDLSRIQEERRKFPDSFEMKSYFDLVSSILSVSKDSLQNWIICEGQDDQNYLSTYFSEKIDNLNILPIGGKGGVRKIYEYLRIAAEDKSEREHITGKILCIFDSDPEIIPITPLTKNAKSSLKILRFQVFSDGRADLVEPSPAGYYTETELEDALNAQDYYNSARSVIRRKAPTELRDAFLGCKLKPDSKFAGINYDLNFLELSFEAHKIKPEIKKFLCSTEIKSEISKIYTAKNELPDWINTIMEFFSLPTTPQSTNTEVNKTPALEPTA